jgi:glycosyltransferase involved in cell wall biosynthesis
MQRMDKPAISIIIPVYNGEKHICRCVDSVLNQTFQDLEILLLDDGSSDNSSSLLSSYAKQHPGRVKVFFHDNMGAAKTRNKGMKLANAEYIMFLDQDDFVDRDYCETYYKRIAEGNCDVVMGGYRRPDFAGKIVKKMTPKDRPFYKYMVLAAWAKIHRTKFLIDNNLIFYDNAIGEDIIFTLREICATEKIEIVQHSGYNWFFNEDSVSNTRQRGLEKNIDALFALLNEISSIQKNPDEMFEYCIVRILIYYLLYCGKTDTPENFMRCEKALFQWLERNHPHYKTNKYVRFPPKGETFAVAAAVTIFLLLRKLKSVGIFAKFYCADRRRANGENRI